MTTLYFLDSDEIDIDQFLDENGEDLTDDERARILALQPGQVVKLGGGASAEFEIRAAFSCRSCSRPLGTNPNCAECASELDP